MLALIASLALSCVGDADRSRKVDMDDILAVMAAWGTCGPPCPCDLNGDGVVGVDDLLAVTNDWECADVVAVLNVTAYPWLPAADGEGRKINYHNVGETDTNAAIANDSPFPGEIGIQPLTGVNDATQIGAVNATGGGATSSAATTELRVDAHIHLPSDWTPQGDGFNTNCIVKVGSTGAAADSGAICFSSSTAKPQLFDGAGNLIATGAVAAVAGTAYDYQWTLDSVQGKQSLDIFKLNGTTYTLIDSIPLTTADFSTGGTMFAPTFQFITGQPIRVGSTYTATGGFIAPNGYRVADQRVAGFGNYQNLSATTAWRSKATTITEAAFVAALLSRDCAGASETDYAFCPAGTTATKLVSMTLTDHGIASDASIYWSRFMNCFYNSAAAGGTTARSGIRYNGTDYFCTATGPGVRVAAVGTLPHARGLRAGSTGWNVTPTAALLRSAEIIMEFSVNGTSDIRWDSGDLLTMYATPGGASSEAAAIAMNMQMLMRRRR